MAAGTRHEKHANRPRRLRALVPVAPVSAHHRRHHRPPLPPPPPPPPLSFPTPSLPLPPSLPLAEPLFAPCQTDFVTPSPSLSSVKLRPCRVAVDGKRRGAAFPPTNGAGPPGTQGMWRRRGEKSCQAMTRLPCTVIQWRGSERRDSARGPRAMIDRARFFGPLRQCCNEPLINGITGYPCGATNSAVPICSQSSCVYDMPACLWVPKYLSLLSVFFLSSLPLQLGKAQVHSRGFSLRCSGHKCFRFSFYQRHLGFLKRF